MPSSMTFTATILFLLGHQGQSSCRRFPRSRWRIIFEPRIHRRHAAAVEHVTDSGDPAALVEHEAVVVLEYTANAIP